MKTLSILVFVSLFVHATLNAQETKVFENGLPGTIVAQKKTYTIEKCEMTATSGLIEIKIYGEGLGFGSFDKNGKPPIKCYFKAKNQEYHSNITGAEKGSNIFIFNIPPGTSKPEPETIVFHAVDDAKNKRIEINCN